MGEQRAVEVGDYDLRGVDFETYLIGPITDRIIDADRQVRGEWSNGFPNWFAYRSVLAGDSYLHGRLRNWCVAYAIAYCEAGGVRKGLPADEMGCLAGWDAYYALHNKRWLIAGQDVADVAGVDPKTYRKVRNRVFAAMRASLDEYWVRLQIAVRQVWMRERWQPEPSKVDSWRPAIGQEDLPYEPGLRTDGNGNYWAHPE